MVIEKHTPTMELQTLFDPQERAYAEQVHPPITITDTDRLLKC